MWRKAKVTVGDETADQALVDFADKTATKPEWLEWPGRVDIDTAIMIGDETRYAGPAQAIARQWHIPLMPTASKPAVVEQEAAVDAAEKGPNQ
jgi:hypothetical protein